MDDQPGDTGGDPTVSLLARLRHSQEATETDLQRLHDLLQESPEQIALPLCSLVDEMLRTDPGWPLLTGIIQELLLSTRRHPEVIPLEMIRRWYALVEQVSPLTTLAIAILYARLRPDEMIAEGLLHVLRVTAMMLVRPNDPAFYRVQLYGYKLALELWNRVARYDAPTLVALLEACVANFGWEHPLSQFFAQKLIEAAGHDPGVIDDALALLESIDDDLMDSAIQRPAHFVKELTKAREKFQRRAIAEKIGAHLASLEWEAPVVQERNQPAFKPDPRVDQLLEDFLSDDDYRQYEAGSQLGKQIGSPSPALVTGICEAIEELAGFDLNHDRIGQLAIALSLATDHQPELTPADLIQDLLANYSFDDSSQTLLYAILARVRPDWIVENRLVRALGVAVDQRSFNTMFLSNLGVAYPELVIRFADLWWQQVGWDMTTGSEIAQAFEQIAGKRPEQIEAMIALVKAQQGEPLGAGMIDLRAGKLSAHIEKLVRIKGDQAQ